MYTCHKHTHTYIMRFAIYRNSRKFNIENHLFFFAQSRAALDDGRKCHADNLRCGFGAVTRLWQCSICYCEGLSKKQWWAQEFNIFIGKTRANGSRLKMLIRAHVFGTILGNSYKISVNFRYIWLPELWIRFDRVCIGHHMSALWSLS